MVFTCKQIVTEIFPEAEFRLKMQTKSCFFILQRCKSPLMRISMSKINEQVQKKSQMKIRVDLQTTKFFGVMWAGRQVLWQ